MARAAIEAAQPQTGSRPPHVEQIEVAIRVGNRLHGNDKPFSIRLVFVLQTQLRTDLSRAEIQTELLGLGVDLFTGDSTLKAQFSDADDDQIQFGLLGGYREGGLAEDVIGVIADAESVVLDGLAEVICVFGPRAELDGLEDLELVLDRFDHQLTCQEKTNTFIATKFVENRFNLSQSPIVVLHDTPPFSSL